MNLVLASASARRVELLKRISKEFKVIVSEFDENTIPYNNDIQQYVMTLAQGKAEEVAERIKSDAPKDTYVIGCDTVVFFKDVVLGKPKDENEAFRMLELLSENTHSVFSGIAIANLQTGITVRDYVRTEVSFSKLSKEMIEKYISNGDCMDKAGSYGIQGDAAVFVEGINGCFYNVVGLPLNKLHKMLREMGVNL